MSSDHHLKVRKEHPSLQRDAKETMKILIRLDTPGEEQYPASCGEAQLSEPDGRILAWPKHIAVDAERLSDDRLDSECSIDACCRRRTHENAVTRIGIPAIC